MSKTLYMTDSYMREFESEVESADGTNIVLKDTAFYPHSGGQPNDTGKIIHEEEEYKVVDVIKDAGKIVHVIDREGLSAGDKIKGIIDWTRRYNLMRAHTATHVLCNILHKETGGLITGNQLYEDRLRVDFNLENYDRELLEKLVDKANEVLANEKEVTSYFLPREDALNVEGALKLANKLPPEVKELRIVEIKDVDVQVDGGTHVKNTKEVGKLKLIKTENKGKNNRRLVVSLEQNI
jgi:Ser-tRNA(Ala) deacylase AlaX